MSLFMSNVFIHTILCIRSVATVVYFIVQDWALLLLICGGDVSKQCVGGCVGEDDEPVCRKKKKKSPSCQEAKDRLT